MLEGKAALITGGSSGIGYALGRELHRRGAEVYSFDIRMPDEPADGITYMFADITDSSQLQTAFNPIHSIDILVNNAGIMRRGTIFDVEESDWDDIFNVNVKGSWMMLKYARPHLSENPIIVQISSRHAINPSSNPAVYALTKKTVAYLAEILEVTCPEYAVKVAYLGPVDSNVFRYQKSEEEIARLKKEGKVISPQAAAKLIADLIESDNRKLVFDLQTKDYFYE